MTIRQWNENNVAWNINNGFQIKYLIHTCTRGYLRKRFLLLVRWRQRYQYQFCIRRKFGVVPIVELVMWRWISLILHLEPFISRSLKTNIVRVRFNKRYVCFSSSWTESFYFKFILNYGSYWNKSGKIEKRTFRAEVGNKNE